MPKDYEQINPSHPVSEEDRKILRSLVAQNADAVFERQALTAAVRDGTESERQLRDAISHWVGENISDKTLPARVEGRLGRLQRRSPHRLQRRRHRSVRTAP
ncbi:hypothetical protein [Streptomyces sp. uw30]|uniref:hypothetical protein n=1 Tax=Streptomyces sp. uw30 TaxID=1828179 RepID=UPI0011CEAB4F|nr:hypothetical protein [Streptomyces sp. uw30]